MALSKILNASVTDSTLTGAKVASSTITGTNISTATLPNLGRRNLVINGAFQIAQRGASFSPVSHNAYTLDRWQVYKEAGASNITQSTDVPLFLFKNSFGQDTATAATGSTPGLNCFVHKIEGLNTAHLAWGTSAAKTITVSFWVKSTKIGIFTVAIKNSAGNRAYPAEYTVNVTNTWEYKTIVIPGDTTGTWLTTTGIGIQIIQTISVDATRRASGNAWGAGNIYASTNQVNGIDNANNNWIMAGFQVEVGSVATPFEHRSFGEELALCQRYYVQAGGSNYKSIFGAMGWYNTTTSWIGFSDIPVPMRGPPTVTYTGTPRVQNGQAGYNISSLGASLIAPELATLGWGANAGASVLYRAHDLDANNSAALVKVDAEL